MNRFDLGKKRTWVVSNGQTKKRKMEFTVGGQIE